MEPSDWMLRVVIDDDPEDHPLAWEPRSACALFEDPTSERPQCMTRAEDFAAADAANAGSYGQAIYFAARIADYATAEAA